MEHSGSRNYFSNTATEIKDLASTAADRPGRLQCVFIGLSVHACLGSSLFSARVISYPKKPSSCLQHCLHLSFLVLINMT